MKLVLTAITLAMTLIVFNARAEQTTEKPKAVTAEAEAYVNKLLAFDKNKDGKLSRDEITDERFLRVFDRADANKDGTVTKEELTALATQETAASANNQGGPGGGGDFGRGPRGGDGGGPRGGMGMGRGQPGQIMPGFMQDQLKLSDDQKKQLADLQKDVDAKLDKLLTDEQKTQLKNMQNRGPGRGPDGGGGGGGGPGEGRRP